MQFFFIVSVDEIGRYDYVFESLCKVYVYWDECTMNFLLIEKVSTSCLKDAWAGKWQNTRKDASVDDHHHHQHNHGREHDCNFRDQVNDDDDDLIPVIIIIIIILFVIIS